MNDKLNVRQLPGKTECPWHKAHSKNGRDYGTDEMFASGICPLMFHTVYPYFLGALYGAKFTYNEQGDCHVCCPAAKGVDVLVKVRPNDGEFGEGVPPEWRNIIHAEVVKVNGPCDYGHKKGDRFVFPNCMKSRFMCPSGTHTIFPFLKIRTPKCINLKRLRCTDWQENIYYSLVADKNKKCRKVKR